MFTTSVTWLSQTPLSLARPTNHKKDSESNDHGGASGSHCVSQRSYHSYLHIYAGESGIPLQQLTRRTCNMLIGDAQSSEHAIVVEKKVYYAQRRLYSSNLALE